MAVRTGAVYTMRSLSVAPSCIPMDWIEMTFWNISFSPVLQSALLGALLTTGAHAVQPVTNPATPVTTPSHQGTVPTVATGSGPVVPVAALDVPRYMGKWYEIAHFPNWFQKKCVDSTHAEYTLQPNGRVRVVNRCRLASGEINEAIGEARQVGDGGATSPQLKVRFAPAWLSFLPMVWGDYWVLDLDADYQMVAVGEPTREYLWVLARTPQVSEQAYVALLQRLVQQGFNVSLLQRTAQPQ